MILNSDWKVKLDIEKNDDEKGVIIASFPLTDETWEELSPGNLYVFKDGIKVFPRYRKCMNNKFIKTRKNSSQSLLKHIFSSISNELEKMKADSDGQLIQLSYNFITNLNKITESIFNSKQEKRILLFKKDLERIALFLVKSQVRKIYDSKLPGYWLIKDRFNRFKSDNHAITDDFTVLKILAFLSGYFHSIARNKRIVPMIKRTIQEGLYFYSISNLIKEEQKHLDLKISTLDYLLKNSLLNFLTSYSNEDPRLYRWLNHIVNIKIEIKRILKNNTTSYKIAKNKPNREQLRNISLKLAYYLNAIQYTDKMYALFVYGTLKRGYPNHIYINSKNSIYLGKGRTVNKYALYANRIPYLISSKHIHNVHGEVYLITKNNLRSIDKLEGHPHWYLRKEIPVSLNSGRYLIAYSYFNDSFYDGYLVHNGNF